MPAVLKLTPTVLEKARKLRDAGETLVDTAKALGVGKSALALALSGEKRAPGKPRPKLPLPVAPRTPPPVVEAPPPAAALASELPPKELRKLAELVARLPAAQQDVLLQAIPMHAAAGAAIARVVGTCPTCRGPVFEALRRTD